MDSLALKCHHYFQNQNNKKATHSFSPRSLIFKLQEEVLKPETRSFENASIVTFK